jgi:hypothetical protein
LRLVAAQGDGNCSSVHGFENSDLYLQMRKGTGSKGAVAANDTPRASVCTSRHLWRPSDTSLRVVRKVLHAKDGQYGCTAGLDLMAARQAT